MVTTTNASRWSGSRRRTPRADDVARWLKNKNPDHWHSAEMFADVAALQKPYLSIQPIGDVLKAAGGGFVG
jgi:hypothetical protein